MVVKHICLALSTWHITKEEFINLYKFKKKRWLRSFLISFKDAESHYCIPWNWKSLKSLCRSAFLFWIKSVFLLFLIARPFLSNLIKMDFLMSGVSVWVWEGSDFKLPEIMCSIIYACALFCGQGQILRRIPQKLRSIGVDI